MPRNQLPGDIAVEPASEITIRVRGPRREFFVQFAIAATALLIVSMIAILCWRWMTTVAPVLLVIDGNPSLETQPITIRARNNGSVIQLKLLRQDAFKTICYLLPGIYEVTVGATNTPILIHEIVIQDSRGHMLNLTNVHPPTTQP